MALILRSCWSFGEMHIAWLNKPGDDVFHSWQYITLMWDLIFSEKGGNKVLEDNVWAETWRKQISQEEEEQAERCQQALTRCVESVGIGCQPW